MVLKSKFVLWCMVCNEKSQHPVGLSAASTRLTIQSVLQPLEFIIPLLAAPSQVWGYVNSLVLKCYGKIVVYMFQERHTFFIRYSCSANQITSLILLENFMQILCEQWITDLESNSGTHFYLGNFKTLCSFTWQSTFGNKWAGC